MSLVLSKASLSTVEVDMDSIPEKFYGYDRVVISAIEQHAKKNKSIRATIYVYQGPSVTFHEQTFSAFFGVAGSSKFLKLIYDGFDKVPGVRVRYSDDIDASTATREFHIQDGIVWQPSDYEKWFTHDGTDKAETDDWEVDDSEEQVKLVPVSVSEQQAEVADTNPTQGVRFRRARADASVGSIKRAIEKVFGLPDGSISICGPEGKPIRADAKILTLRKRWDSN